jgi:nitric oxide synthase oxygenase domain/subunit
MFFRTDCKALHMPRNLPLWYAYSKCRGRLLWNALAVVGAVDIHLAAAIGAIKQASISEHQTAQRIGFSP